ncbi:putative transcriptional regulatory protein, LuxR family [Bradyrhizobium sp. ORS 278]|nr:putative transcriptional regulatory protein, LuxR family [Bradyrhizobium sp. ORS 278]
MDASMQLHVSARNSISANATRLNDAAGLQRNLDSFAGGGVLLDKDGTIVEVSEIWKRWAAFWGLGLPNYGIGENYLKHCVYNDPSSIEIIRGLKQLLERKIDFFAMLYPCERPQHREWFLMVGFIPEANSELTAVTHIDFSSVLPDKAEMSARLVSTGAAALGQMEELVTRVVRRSIAETMSRPKAATGDAPVQDQGSPDKRALSKLTRSQLDILGHLAIGATNRDIAIARGISINTVKTQVAALTRTLKFSNRTQTALFAARNGYNKA